MGKIIELPFTTSLVACLGRHLLNQEPSGHFHSCVVVFPHQRPRYYLREYLSHHLGAKPFLAPRFFTIDQFMQYLSWKKAPFLQEASFFDRLALLYETVQELPIEKNPLISKLAHSFDHFLYWGKELLDRITDLDTELVNPEQFRTLSLDFQEEALRKSSDVLIHLQAIREAYHRKLLCAHRADRGLFYQLAAEEAKESGMDAPPVFLFLCGFFALTRAEETVFHQLLLQDSSGPGLKNPLTTLIVQKDETAWTPFEKMKAWARQNKVEWSQEVGESGSLAVGSRQSAVGSREVKKSRSQGVEESGSRKVEKESAQVFFYAAPDTHAEVVALKDAIFRQIERDPQKTNQLLPLTSEETVVVLPRPDPLIPLLSEVMSGLPFDYNISLGYPLERTALYALIHLLLVLQETAIRREGSPQPHYYVKDYLNVLFHPYLKNFSCSLSASQMRLLVHAVEETLVASGTLFVSLQDVESGELHQRLVQRFAEKVNHQDPTPAPSPLGGEGPPGRREDGGEGGQALSKKVQTALRTLHDIFIRPLEEVKTLQGLADIFQTILSSLVSDSPAKEYPFSGEFFYALWDLLDGLAHSLFAPVPFERAPLFDFFRYAFLQTNVPFEGVPLQGLQVLGLLETRTLRFENVYILDVNEKVLPGSVPPDPWLPSLVRLSLGLPDAEDREEIFRYHFYRLIRGAQAVHLFYKDSEQDVPSRYIEQLQWAIQKERKTLDLPMLQRVSLPARVSPGEPWQVEKTPATLVRLQTLSYSATMLDTYLQCPARFYFEHVLALREKTDLEEEPEAKTIGTLLHLVLQKLYEPYVGKVLTPQAYRAMRSKLEPQPFSDFIQQILPKNSSRSLTWEPRGERYLIQYLMSHRLQAWLEKEQRLSLPIKILALEEKLYVERKVGTHSVRLVGKLDRLDERPAASLQKGQEWEFPNNFLYVVDYKSGSLETLHSFHADEPLAERRLIAKKGSFQLPLYVLLSSAHYQKPYAALEAAFASLRDIDWKPLFHRASKPLDPEAYMQNLFLPTLDAVLGEILNPSIPFERDDSNSRFCQTCPYAVLCRKR